MQENFDKNLIKNFSRKYSAKERKATATQIKEKRNSYFERQLSIKDKIIFLEEQIKANDNDIEQLVDNISEIEKEIQNLENSFFQRIFKYKKIRDANFENSEKNAILENCLLKRDELIENLESYLSLKKDKKELFESRGLIDNFYIGQNEKYLKYCKNQEDRKLENVMKKNNVFFLHGITSDDISEQYTVLKQSVKWEEKVEILLALKPQISCLAKKNNRWSNIGVVLNGGTIDIASERDANSKMNDGKRDNGNSRLLEYEKYDAEEEIKSSLNNDSSLTNEFVISEPGIAGFYIQILDTDDNFSEKYNEHIKIAKNNIYKLSEKFNLPIFFYYNGDLFKAEGINAEKIETSALGSQQQRNGILKEKVSPIELLKDHKDITEMEKQEIIKKIIENMPFKLNFPDLNYYEAYMGGKYSFIRYFLNKSNNNQKKINRLKNRDLEKDYMLEELGSLDYGYKKFNYYLCTEDIKSNSEIIFKKGEKLVQVFYRGIEKIFDSIEVPTSLIPFLISEIKSTHTKKSEDFIKYYENKIDNLTSKKNEYENIIIEGKRISDEQNQTIIENLKERINECSSLLYGFGKMAEENGELYIKELAFQIASKHFPLHEFNSIIDNETDKNGKFIYKLKDLKHIISDTNVELGIN